MTSEDEALPEVLQDFDSEAAQAPEAAESVPAAELAKQLAEANRKAEEHFDRAARMQAEFDNLRRRTEKDLQNAHRFALEKFAKELLSVIDSLELGLSAAVSDSPDVLKLREGMDLTLKQLCGVLEKFNVVAVDPLGEKFNPELHQAMAMQPVENVEPNSVVRVFQKGYTLNDRLLRPATVIIAQAVSPSPHIDEQA